MANFPTTLDNDASLHVAKNNLYTTLTAQVLVGETTSITVASTTGWDSSGYLSVDLEIIRYATTDGTHFYTLTRAQDGTAAAQHEVGAVVELRPIAMHHNDSKDAIIALETKVGVDGSAVTGTLDYKVTVLSGLTGNVDYYVDPVAGNDGNPGTNAQPFLTIQHAVDVIPKFLNGFTANVYLKPSLVYSEFVNIEGFHGGYFNVASVGFDPATVLITGLTDNDIFDIYNCTALINIQSISMRVVSTAGPSSWSGVYAFNSSVAVIACNISDSGVGGTNTVGIYSYNASFVSATSVFDYDANKVDFGLYASGSGEILYDYASTNIGDTFAAATNGGLISSDVILKINGGTGVLKSVAGLVTPNATLDDISDGSSYERVAAADVTSGHVIQLIAGAETLTPISATTDTFQLNSDASGLKLKDVSGALSLRNAADNAYANLYCANIVQTGSFVTPGTRTSSPVYDTTPMTPYNSQFVGWGLVQATGRNSGDNIYHVATGDIVVAGGSVDVLCYTRTSTTDTAAGSLAHTFTGGSGTYSGATAGYYFFKTADKTGTPDTAYTVTYLSNSSGGGGGSISYDNMTVTGNLLVYTVNSTTKLQVKDAGDIAILAVDTTNQKVKIYNNIEFQTDSTITNASGTLTLGNSTSQTYFGPDGGATAHNIFLENGSVAVRYANAASAVAVGQAVYISAADTVALAKADAIATMPAIGIVVATPTTTACFVSEIGRIGGLTFAAANSNVYVSTATAGSLQTTVPSGANAVIQKVGKSRSLTDLDIKIDPQFLVLL